MRGSGLSWLRRRTTSRREPTIYDHNMAQALMLLMESQAERSSGNADEAKNTASHAKEIADRALDMAVKRVTADNTIRYVRTAVLAFFVWTVLTLLLLPIFCWKLEVYSNFELNRRTWRNFFYNF